MVALTRPPEDQVQQSRMKGVFAAPPLRKVANAVHELADKHPEIVLGVALGSGVILGWLIKRR